MSALDKLERAKDVLKRFERHSARFEDEFSGEKSPKKQNWRPQRFCTRDVVLGVVAIRYNTNKGYTEVDVFGSYDPVIAEDYAGTKLSMLFVLSDAFMSGGAMEIHFTKNFGKEVDKVPEVIYDMAYDYGVRLKNTFKGYISATEARMLYLALSDLSPEARDKASVLHNAGKITAERICFMINKQIWQPEEMEMILTGAKWPEDILLGAIDPRRRQLYNTSLFQASGALLGSFLTRKLLVKEQLSNKGNLIDMEASEMDIEVSFSPSHYAKVYRLREEVEVPWLADGKTQKLVAGSIMAVMIRPRSDGHLYIYGGDDLIELKKMSEALGGTKGVWLGVIYPQDFVFASTDIQNAFIQKAAKLGVNVMVCPEILENFDHSAMRALDASVMIRK